MSTCLDIVRRALRLVAGETGVPGGQEGQDALERLQSVVFDLPGFFHNGSWRDRQVASAYTAREGDRIVVTAPGVVTLPALIDVYGQKRAPLDCAKVQITGDAANKGVWLYSATKGAWGRVDGLTLASELPFGPEDDDGLAAQLAVALAPEYGAQLDPVTVTRSNQSKASFRARFKRPAPCEPERRDYV